MIDAFSGQWAFLSNFFMVDVEYDGHRYPSAEHAYQAAKSIEPGVRLQMTRFRTPGQAKVFGQKIRLRPGWDAMKLDVMEAILRDKFSTPIMRQRLASTGTHELVEGNWWNDTYWGVCNGRGENMLGKLLMMLREEFRA